jgi:hypothetical protein
VLRNPFGDVQPTGLDPRQPFWGDWFGWFVFNGGDCGSPHDDPVYAGALDAVKDLVVHGEDSDFIGTGSFSAPQVGKVGGLMLYHGRGSRPGPLIVDPRPVLIQRPINVTNGIPVPFSRIGRALARADGWRNCLTGQVEPAIFYSEPDVPWEGRSMAGIVHMIRLPLPPPANPVTNPWWVPRPVVDAWGSAPLLQPTSIVDPIEDDQRHLFGSWITTMDYKGNQTLFPGVQVVISARDSWVWDATAMPPALVPFAGLAYPYLPPTGSCSPPP